MDVACNPWLLVGICTYGHCGDNVVDALIDEAMTIQCHWMNPGNIFKSVLAKQSCGVASTSDPFCIERVTGTLCFSFLLGIRRIELWSDLPNEGQGDLCGLELFIIIFLPLVAVQHLQRDIGSLSDE